MRNLFIMLLDVVLFGLLLAVALSVILFAGEPFVSLICAN